MSREPRLDNPLKVKKIAYMKATGKRIRAARVAAGLTQIQLARLLGYRTRNAVSNWERGENLPKGGKMYELARHLKVSAAHLFDVAPVEPASPDTPGESALPPPPDDPDAIMLASARPVVFSPSEVYCVQLAEPPEYVLILRDPQGRSLAVSANRASIERIEKALDLLKKFV